MRGHRDLTVAGAGAVACAVLALLIPWPALSVVFALPLCLLLPGYAIAAATFARRPLLRPQLFALSIALSLCALALGAVALNYLGGLHAGSWALLLAALVLACCRLAAVRRPAPERIRRRPLPRRPPLPQLALYGVALAIAAAAIGLAFVPLPASNAIGHTELWISTATGEDGSVVTVGVKSQEQEETSYFVRVRGERGGPPAVRLFDLAPGQERTIRIPVQTPAVPMKAIATLFRQSDPERIYRRVYDWLPGNVP